jgi:hypothetical protein
MRAAISRPSIFPTAVEGRRRERRKKDLGRK